MKVESHKVLVVGCGLMGGGVSANYQSYGSTAKAVPTMELVGGVDIDPARQVAFGDSFGVRTFQDIGTALSATMPEIVVISTPPAAHLSSSLQVMESVWCPPVMILEKPACMNPEELVRLRHASIQTGCQIYVNHSRRMNHALSSLPTSSEWAQVGELRHIEFRYYNGWMNNGVHAIDLIAILTGLVPETEGSSSARADVNSADVYFRGRLPNGVSVWLTPYDLGYQLFEADFYFAGGRIGLRDFCNEGFLQTSVANKSNEVVLSDNLHLDLAGDMNLFSLMSLVSDALSGMSATDLESVKLENLGPLMDFMFKVQEESTKSIWGGSPD